MKRPATITAPSAQMLADTFAAILTRWLSPDEMRDVVAKNIADADPTVCHSHNYCDSNMAMLEAMETLGIEFDSADDACAALMNGAWDIAKAAHFATPQYRCEFRDFDHMPVVPEGFEDVSWHNDASPSFRCDATGNLLYLNYETLALREYEASCFVLSNGEDGNTVTLYCGDDIEHAVRVARGEA